MFVVEELQLGKAGSVPEQEVDVGVSGKAARVEDRGSLRVGLQLLVLVVMQQAEAEFELVSTLGPRQIVPVLKAFISVLPWIVAFTPVHVEWRALQIDLRHVVDRRITDREEACCCPPGRLKERAARTFDRSESNLVSAVEDCGFVEQVGWIRLSQVGGSRIGMIGPRGAP